MNVSQRDILKYFSSSISRSWLHHKRHISVSLLFYLFAEEERPESRITQEICRSSSSSGSTSRYFVEINCDCRAVKMKCLFVGIVLFACSHVIWGQDIIFPKDKEITHVSGDNNTVITERIPVSVAGECPKNMLLFSSSGAQSAWVCDCIPRYLYFPVNDSCHEAYRQGPCPLHHYVVLPEDNAVPRCEPNPCFLDGVVPFNGTCNLLRSVGGACGPKVKLNVNEFTFRLECEPIEVVQLTIIDTIRKRQPMPCPPGSRRVALGDCRVRI